MILTSGLNTVQVTLNELVTISSPEFICIFVNDSTSKKYACKLGTDLSSYPDRYNEFEITVSGNPNPLLSEVDLYNQKSYHYFIYETADASTFDYAGVDTLDLRTMTGLVEQGKMSYLINPSDLMFYKDLRTSIKTYNE